MKIIHFCAGLEGWNGMANTARQFVAEETAVGHDSQLTINPAEVVKGVDVVHIHGAWLPILWKVAKKAKRIGAKLIVRPAGSYDPVRLNFHGWKKRLVAPFEHAMLNRADVVQATCKAERRWICDYHPKARIELTDLKRFFRLKAMTPTEFHQPLHLLYLGRRHPLKGVEYLENAVAGMQDVELRIVSNAFGEEKEKVWSWCDVLVLPTLSENFGRVVAEALERGKRVVTTDGAPVWEGQPGVTYLKGYVAATPRRRVEMIARAVANMLENPAKATSVAG